MSDAKSFLDQAYELGDPEQTHAFYAKWARTYDEELRQVGYASPGHVAEAMADAVHDTDGPLLDLGCGTGLSGEALRDAGITCLDGSDFSAEMLAAAKTKDVYRTLIQSDLAKPIPAEKGDYQNCTAVGVFSPGHAPPEMIASVIDVLQPGGCFGFTLNDHALAEKHYEAAIDNLVSHDRIEITSKAYVDHIPGYGLKAMIYVLRAR